MNAAELDRRFPFERTRARMLRVDHAGERGAVAVYSAQLLAGRWLGARTADFLEEAREHEREHRRRFRVAMRERGVRPCWTGAVWVAGGYALGLLSLLGGRRGVMACTAAIEQAVHSHLGGQIDYLKPRDGGLAATIEAINAEEVEHMRAGQAGYDPGCQAAGRFTGAIELVVHGLIHLSTFGDSARLPSALHRPPRAPVAPF